MSSSATVMISTNEELKSNLEQIVRFLETIIVDMHTDEEDEHPAEPIVLKLLEKERDIITVRGFFWLRFAKLQNGSGQAKEVAANIVRLVAKMYRNFGPQFAIVFAKKALLSPHQDIRRTGIRALKAIDSHLKDRIEVLQEVLRDSDDTEMKNLLGLFLEMNV